MNSETLIMMNANGSILWIRQKPRSSSSSMMILLEQALCFMNCLCIQLIYPIIFLETDVCLTCQSMIILLRAQYAGWSTWYLSSRAL